MIIVSVGVIISTLASMKTDIAGSNNGDDSNQALNQWIFGIFLIAVAVILSSILGNCAKVPFMILCSLFKL